MSAITTNIRIGAGGAYAIVSQALGLEVGGSLGIPRYISQGLAVTMYIFGFREGWLGIFPDHNAVFSGYHCFCNSFYDCLYQCKSSHQNTIYYHGDHCCYRLFLL